MTRLVPHHVTVLVTTPVLRKSRSLLNRRFLSSFPEWWRIYCLINYLPTPPPPLSGDPVSAPVSPCWLHPTKDLLQLPLGMIVSIFCPSHVGTFDGHDPSHSPCAGYQHHCHANPFHLAPSWGVFWNRTVECVPLKFCSIASHVCTPAGNWTADRI